MNQSRNAIQIKGKKRQVRVTAALASTASAAPASASASTQSTMTGSEIARSGFNAEKYFQNNTDIKNSLQNYFNKPINRIDTVSGRKKSDSKIIFEDGTFVHIQNKKN